MLTLRLKTVAIAIVSTAVMALCGSAQAQTKLRYKFKEGEKISYTQEQKQTSKGNIGGMEIESSMSNTVDSTMAVKSVKGGSAEVVQSIDRFRMKMEAAPFGGFEYDSKDGGEPEGIFGQLLGPLLGQMVGAEFTMTLSDRGVASDLKLPEKLKEALGGNPAAAQLGSGFTEDGLKQMAQAGIELPEEAISKGKTWDKSVEMKLPFGTMKIKNTYTYQGSETKNGKKLEKIDVKMEQTIEPEAGSPFEITVKNQEAKGTIYFDNNVGRMIESMITQKMQMQISVMGMEIEQDVEATISVKLAETAKKTN